MALEGVCSHLGWVEGVAILQEGRRYLRVNGLVGVASAVMQPLVGKELSQKSELLLQR